MCMVGVVRVARRGQFCGGGQSVGCEGSDVRGEG